MISLSRHFYCVPLISQLIYYLLFCTFMHNRERTRSDGEKRRVGHDSQFLTFFSELVRASLRFFSLSQTMLGLHQNRWHINAERDKSPHLKSL